MSKNKDSRVRTPGGKQKTRDDQVHMTCIRHAGHHGHVNWVADRNDPNGTKCPVCGSES